jgi:hypothetical protein
MIPKEFFKVASKLTGPQRNSSRQLQDQHDPKRIIQGNFKTNRIPKELFKANSRLIGPQRHK